MNLHKLLETGSISVDDSFKFKYHIEVLRLFGVNYKAHMRATYQIDDNWCVWFPKLYPNGDWDNKLSDGGKTIVMVRKHEGVLQEKYMNYPEDEPGQRIVFAHIKDPVSGEKYYKFVGIFTELTGKFQRARCERTSTTLYFDGNGRFDTQLIPK